MTGIVVGVDGSEPSQQALVWAAREAQLRGLSLTAILAWDWLDQHPSIGSRQFNPAYGEADALAALNAYVAEALGPDPAVGVAQVAVCDLPARALLRATEDASLLVVGARGLGGFRGLLLGSVSQHCLHHATCPLAIIRPGALDVRADHVERILVGIDGSAASLRALRWAAEEARFRQASLEVVHAYHLPPIGPYPYLGPTADPARFEEAARETIDAALRTVDTSGLAHPVEGIVGCGGPAATILETGKGADLIVTGSRGHGGFTGLVLGSVSHHLAHHATTPLVIVPAEH